MNNPNPERLVFDQYLSNEILPTFNSYLGYSVTNYWGSFSTGEYIVTSAPRNNHFEGRVNFLVISWKSKIILVLNQIFRHKVYLIPVNEINRKNNWRILNGDSNAKGEYFGASVLALDINGDRIEDLIVAAPFYSDQRSREIGRIYVYMNNKARISSIS